MFAVIDGIGVQSTDALEEIELREKSLGKIIGRGKH